MSKGPKTRGSYGPTSPRGIYSRSMAAPGKSLDMPDEPVKKRVGGKIKKMAGGGTPLPYAPPTVPVRQDTGPIDNDPGRQRYNKMLERIDKRQQAVVNNRMKDGPKMRNGGSVGSASKRADGCAVRGKTRGKMV